jgi:hypothetical protein
VADLLTRAQIALLADLLQTDAASLAGLERLGADDIEALRHSISDALFNSLSSVFARVSKLAPLIPNAVVAAVAQRAVPPKVAGRAGGALGLAHEDRAVGVLSRMKPAYLSEAAPYVDPRVIPHFAPKLPAHLLIPIAKELLRRRDYLTASRYVEYATEQHIVEFEKAIHDDEDIVQTSVLVARVDVLNRILQVAGPGRLSRMATAASAGSPEFVLAMLAMLSRIDPELAKPAVAELLGNPDADFISRVVGIAVREDALAELLDLTRLLSDDSLHHFASAQLLQEASFRQQAEKIADTAERRKSWKRIQRAMQDATEPARAAD